MRKEIEEIKKQLSSLSENTYSIYVSELDNPLMLKITRKTYENLCKKVWNKFYEPINNALKSSKLTKEEIDKIMFVGGSSRTPKIQEMVENYFPGKEALQNIYPEEVVAYGATIVAAMDEDGIKIIEKIEFEDEISMKYSKELSDIRSIIINDKIIKDPNYNNFVEKLINKIFLLEKEIKKLLKKIK